MRERVMRVRQFGGQVVPLGLGCDQLARAQRSRSQVRKPMTDLLDLMQGRKLRDAGMTSVNANESELWKQAADDVILELADSGKQFTADDVRSRVGDPPHHHNAMGARFGTWAKRGRIRIVGFTHMARPNAHARRTPLYRGVRP